MSLQLSDDAIMENRACESAIAEFRAQLEQSGKLPAVIRELMIQMEQRIELRRVLSNLNQAALKGQTK